MDESPFQRKRNCKKAEKRYVTKRKKQNFTIKMSFTKLDAKNKMSILVFISKESFLICETVSKLGVFVVVH